MIANSLSCELSVPVSWLHHWQSKSIGNLAAFGRLAGFTYCHRKLSTCIHTRKQITHYHLTRVLKISWRAMEGWRSKSMVTEIVCSIHWHTLSSAQNSNEKAIGQSNRKMFEPLIIRGTLTNTKTGWLVQECGAHILNSRLQHPYLK